MNTHRPTTTKAAGRRPVEGGELSRSVRALELNLLIGQACTEIRRHLPAIGDLVDTRQHRLPFTTVEARRATDAMIRDERAARHAYTGRMATHAWLRPNTTSQVSGQSPAPVSIGAVSLADEIAAYLSDVAHRLATKMERAGICWIGERQSLTWLYATADQDDDTATPDVDQLLRHVQLLTSKVTNPDRLEPIHRTLEDLATRARHLTEGDDKAAVPDPCPWCGRHTLVVHFAEEVIRCEADPHTGRNETCLCSDTYCPCRTTGSYRHQWFRSRKDAPTGSATWYGLRDAQAHAAREAAAAETEDLAGEHADDTTTTGEPTP